MTAEPHSLDKNPGILRSLGNLTFGPTNPPSGVKPVTDFDLTRVLGKWYEIMRMNHTFEDGLTNVTAEYALLEGGRISVTNGGFDPVSQRWRKIRGTAKPSGDPTIGSLDVSFFWPLRRGLHVIDIDAGYTHMMLTGAARNRLWILAREPELHDMFLDPMLELAREYRYSTANLVHVIHDREPPVRSGWVG